MSETPEWRRLVRQRLPSLGLPSEREAEVGEELAQLLEEFHAAEDAPPPDAPEFDRWLATQVPAWGELGNEIRRTGRPLGSRLATGRSVQGSPTKGEPMSALLSSLVHDFRFALRKLAQSPGFALVAVLTLGLAIGLNSAIFSVVNSVLFRPFPVAGPDRLAMIYTNEPELGLMSHLPMAYPDYQDIVEAMREKEDAGFADAAAYSLTLLAYDDGDTSELVTGEMVTGNYFDLLGVAAALGRSLSVEDDRHGDPRAVAMLSHNAWQRRFGGDPAVLGRTLHLNGQPVTIVGVAPEGFGGLLRGVTAELWIPMQLSRSLRATAVMNLGEAAPDLHRLDDRGRRWHWMVGRLAPGADLDAARGEIDALAGRLAAAYPETNEERRLSVVPASEVSLLPGVDGVIHTASWVVLGLVGLVLLIAGANVANMLLARAVERRKEIATRLALGASRGALIRQLLVESLVLALAGGLVGLALTFGSNRLLNAAGHVLPLPVELALDLAVDTRVLGFALFAALLTALAFGLAPALESSRANLAAVLHESGRANAGGRRRRRLRGALVVGQVALSLVLLICAGLSVRSMVNALHIDPGFTAEGVVAASFAPHYQGYDQPRTEAFYRELAERLEALPETRAVAYASHLPLTFEMNIESVTTETGQADALPDDAWTSIDNAEVGPGYFDALRIPLLAGRDFSERDTDETPLVAVVNESFARQFWPQENPIGQRFRMRTADEDYEVVGLVRDSKYRTLGEDPRPFLYRSLGQHHVGSQTLLLRTAGHPSAALASLRHAARELDERIAIAGLSTVDEAISGSLLLPRLGATIFGLFGLIGLVLAAVGLYGVVAYAVSQRTHEIGIRMALGARRGDILGMVVREGFALVVLGVMLGLAGALAVTRILSSILYGISASDAGTFLLVSVFLVAVALVASWVPARRAAGVDPLHALRHE